MPLELSQNLAIYLLALRRLHLEIRQAFGAFVSETRPTG
jgi:hypothetical protein